VADHMTEKAYVGTSWLNFCRSHLQNFFKKFTHPKKKEKKRKKKEMKPQLISPQQT
jgi:hypothetical protein